MANNAQEGHAVPSWFVPPGEGDHLVIVVLVIVLAGLYGIVYLYAMFDRWAEHQSKGTPLARTIPTLLLIALIYEIFPVDHFNVLLPLSAILLALMADWSRFHLNGLAQPPVSDQDDQADDKQDAEKKGNDDV